MPSYHLTGRWRLRGAELLFEFASGYLKLELLHSASPAPASAFAAGSTVTGTATRATSATPDMADRRHRDSSGRSGFWNEKTDDRPVDFIQVIEIDPGCAPRTMPVENFFCFYEREIRSPS